MTRSNKKLIFYIAAIILAVLELFFDSGKLLGYYLGLGRGTDPDKPRNLAKSVTVK